MMTSDDIAYMKHALSLARRGLGRVAPNPAVGCVIVSDGTVVGYGWTADGGRPHAEPQALAMAGRLAKGACVYVSLEPCSHYGQTEPCAEVLIDTGVARVVVACTDPDPRVSGRGVEMLKAAGIEVVEGVLEEEALALNAGFILKVTEKRPFVTLKCAVSSDNKIAVAPGESTQISGPEAHRYLHHLRSFYDAILVGKITWAVDKPRLTTRIDGYEHKAQKVVMDRPVSEMLSHLAEQGMTRLLVEGGAKVHASFLESGLYDEVILLKSPKVLGAQGVDSADFSGLDGLRLEKKCTLGEDVLEIYRREG